MGEFDEQAKVIPLAEERLDVAKREVERARVVVRTHVDTREELAAIGLRQDEAEVERVPVDRVPVDRVVEASPGVRAEDGVLIVPILEERPDEATGSDGGAAHPHPHAHRGVPGARTATFRAGGDHPPGS